MLTKAELHATQQQQLEQLIRDLRHVEGQKSDTDKVFNKEIKRINEAVDSLLNEINEGITPMFDSEGKPLITLAEVK